MKLVYAAALSIIAGAAQAAESVPSLNVPTGAVIDCLPVPNIETGAAFDNSLRISSR